MNNISELLNLFEFEKFKYDKITYTHEYGHKIEITNDTKIKDVIHEIKKCYIDIGKLFGKKELQLEIKNILGL